MWRNDYVMTVYFLSPLQRWMGMIPSAESDENIAGKWITVDDEIIFRALISELLFFFLQYNVVYRYFRV